LGNTPDAVFKADNATSRLDRARHLFLIRSYEAVVIDRRAGQHDPGAGTAGSAGAAQLQDSVAGRVEADNGRRAEKAKWVKPGLRGRVRFLKGEETLRHASLQDWSED